MNYFTIVAQFKVIDSREEFFIRHIVSKRLLELSQEISKKIVKKDIELGAKYFAKDNDIKEYRLKGCFYFPSSGKLSTKEDLTYGQMVDGWPKKWIL